MEPGLSDVFARYAADELIDEIGVRDGADLVVEGYDFAPSFSIWTTIEECLNPPVVWEKGRGWYTTELFSEPEVFTFPQGIGPVECVNVEHEGSALLVPRGIECDRVTFKYGLGDEFIDVLKTLRKLGLDRTEPLQVDGLACRRATSAAALPDPDDARSIGRLGRTLRGHLGDRSRRRRVGPRGLPASRGRQRVRRGAATARRPSCGRRRPIRWSRSSCSRPARGPAAASSAPRFPAGRSSTS